MERLIFRLIKWANFDSRREVVSYFRENVHRVPVNRLVGLSLTRKSVVRLTVRPNMTTAVYRGC